MLEMARKEANSLNAPLAEFLGKMGRSRAKLRDIVTPIGPGERAAGQEGAAESQAP